MCGYKKLYEAIAQLVGRGRPRQKCEELVEKRCNHQIWRVGVLLL